MAGSGGSSHEDLHMTATCPDGSTGRGVVTPESAPRRAVGGGQEGGRRSPTDDAAWDPSPMGRAASTRELVTPPAALRGPGGDELDAGEPTGRMGKGVQRPPMRTIGDNEQDTPHILQSHPDSIDPRIVPRLGMMFRNVEEAHKFYGRYAMEVGFPVKKYRERKNCKWLNCSMEGKPLVRAVDNPKVRTNTSSKRTECKAGMKLKKIYDDDRKNVIMVRIDLLHLEHNHEFLKQQEEIDQLRCNKTHDPKYMEFIGAMQDSRVPQHCIMDCVSEMHGGAENAARRRLNNANDVSKLLTFFTSCKKENPQFFSDFQLDNEGKITSMFWSHASQQLDYINFGDAVTFDTTHKTNLYDKPICMFVGANHHLQCAIFGFALLGDETVETFEWVFNAIKTCMGIEGPRVMLTDQDPAMPIALLRVFPNTIHRLCLWHVQNRFMPFLNELYARFEEEDFKIQFQSIIHHPLTPREFETSWAMMLDKFNLHDDVTLKNLYEIREEWIPAFFKQDYCRRSHVDGNTPLHEFAKQMLKLLHSRKMKEAKETLACKGQRETITLYEFEVKVARAYTRAVMNRFEESIKYATAYKITRDPDGGVNYWVVQHTKRSNKIVWGQHQFKVFADVEAGRYKCECKQWEHTGCWFSRDDKKSKGKDGETKSYRQKTMLKNTMKVINKASMSKAGHDKYLDVMHELNKLLDRVEPDIGGYESCIDSDGEDNHCNEVVLIEDRARYLKEAVPVTNMQQDGNINGGARHETRGQQNNAVSVGGECHPTIEARKKLDFDVEGISLERLDRAKPKGRTIKETETVVRKLGAKGEKKKNRKCKICGIADGHNSRTCLSVEDNRDRLSKLGVRKRGRPPGQRTRRPLKCSKT
ncbi:hypothetical protein U9M48_035862 [Paspalum notatum var. saurae]|uniref:Protein FAR1-RELATED SEQUENCE n=1 Tax=Paspalum notatum var. saurae TaxID=547442 RepID=A0AAQ3UBW9_PASNO